MPGGTIFTEATSNSGRTCASARTADANRSDAGKASFKTISLRQIYHGNSSAILSRSVYADRVKSDGGYRWVGVYDVDFFAGRSEIIVSVYDQSEENVVGAMDVAERNAFGPDVC